MAENDTCRYSREEFIAAIRKLIDAGNVFISCKNGGNILAMCKCDWDRAVEKAKALIAVDEDRSDSLYYFLNRIAELLSMEDERDGSEDC